MTCERLSPWSAANLSKKLVSLVRISPPARSGKSRSNENSPFGRVGRVVADCDTEGVVVAG